MDQKNIDAELLRVQAVAEIADVSVMTVRRWIERGELPAFRDKTILRVRRVDLDQFIEERLVTVA